MNIPYLGNELSVLSFCLSTLYWYVEISLSIHTKARTAALLSMFVLPYSSRPINNDSDLQMATATRKSFAQIQTAIQELTKQAEAARAREIQGVVAKIKEAVAAYGLTAADLGLSASPAKKAVFSKAAGRKTAKADKRAKGVAYRDGAGNTWGGLGKRPHWLRDALNAGKQLSDFAVK